MQPLKNIQKEKLRVRNRVVDLVHVARKHIRKNPQSYSKGLGQLFTLRKAVYEHLNQLQHEGLLLDAVAWLRRKKLVPRGANWDWHPRQTSGKGEPDLRASWRGKVRLCAEGTAAALPRGSIKDRLKATLKRLPTECEAQRHYCFVRTNEMALVANQIVLAENLPVKVVCLPFANHH